MDRYRANRRFMKANFQELDHIKTDRQLGKPAPPIVKEPNDFLERIYLPEVKEDMVKKNNLYQCFEDRRSYRRFADEDMNIEELSYMLWATSAIQGFKENGGGTLRRVPSGGASHTLETYLIINKVAGLKQGVYMYLPIEHALICLKIMDGLEEIVDEATPRQPYAPHFVCKSPVIFVWTTIPYRAEYKFDVTAHKKILFDAGHLCQNLYLAAESIDCGSCAIGIYDQECIDELIGVDGENEFVVYLSAVGHKIKKD